VSELRALLCAPSALVAFAAGALGAQTASDSIRARIESAVIATDTAALERTRRAIHAQLTPAGLTNPWLHYDLAYVLHRKANVLIIADRAREARALLEEAVIEAGHATINGGGADAIALEGAVSGQLAGAAGMFRAMRVGPRAWKLLDSAIVLAPNDPRAALLHGISRVNAPRAFGGSLEKGEAELRRAIRLFATDASRSPRPTWGRADAHIWLAIALHKRGRTAEARAELQRALELAPGHRWVTGELLPQLDRTP
jgi:tetratricopeptide (TPR) repeat protein